MEPEGTGNVGFFAGEFELPGFLEASRQPGQRCGELLHFQSQAAVRFPFHDFLDVTRPVPVRDPDSGANDARCLDLELSNLDSRYRPIALEFGV